jgi:hypothetical protein
VERARWGGNTIYYYPDSLSSLPLLPFSPPSLSLRKAIRTFFLLRQVSLALQGLRETSLPLSNPDSCVQAGDVLDLNNSDLLAVTVVLKDGARQRRFLVVDLMQIILIEPDAHRLGWGVARFSGFLQVRLGFDVLAVV